MLKKILLLVLILLEINFLYSKDGKSLLGLQWNEMDVQNKEFYLAGLFQGLQKAGQILEIELEHQKQKEFTFSEPFYIYQTKKIIAKYFPNDNANKNEELIKLLDAFFCDGANEKIKIITAIRIINERQKGEIEKSDFWLKKARLEEK